MHTEPCPLARRSRLRAGGASASLAGARRLRGRAEAGTRGAGGFSACAAITALIVAGACSSTSAQQTRRPAPTEVVATVGSAPITLAEVDDKALEQAAPAGAKLSQALYDARQAPLADLVANRLLDAAAKAQGVDRAAPREKEI